MDKTVAADVVRRLRLVDVAYRGAVALDSLRNRSANRRFSQAHPDFPFPPPSLVYLTSGGSSYENYYKLGLERARFLVSLGAKADPPGLRRIYEWGCGTGKTVRRFVEVDPELEVYGTDYDERVIRWCTANIPHVTFKVNGLEPPLPFEDDFFDLLYSFSVYTHLPPDLQAQWLTEQLRIVRPGGLILMSVHGDVYKDRLTPAEREAYDSEGVVVHGGTGAGGPWFTTFNSPHWMEHELLHGYDIVHRDLHPEGAGAKAQDVWVIRTPVATGQ